jgi:hypothetical protein
MKVEIMRLKDKKRLEKKTRPKTSMAVIISWTALIVFLLFIIYSNFASVPTELNKNIEIQKQIGVENQDSALSFTTIVRYIPNSYVFFGFGAILIYFMYKFLRGREYYEYV